MPVLDNWIFSSQERKDNINCVCQPNKATGGYTKIKNFRQNLAEYKSGRLAQQEM